MKLIRFMRQTFHVLWLIAQIVYYVYIGKKYFIVSPVNNYY